LNVRDTSTPETPQEIAGDLFYLRQAVVETSFGSGLKARLDALVESAQQNLRPATQPSKVGPGPNVAEAAALIRERLDAQIESELNAQQDEELNRRTVNVAMQELMLADGARGFFEEDPANIGLSNQQKQQLLPVLTENDRQMAAAGIDSADSTVRFKIVRSTRDRIRRVLTAEQRGKWDAWSSRVLNAATEPAPVPNARGQ